MARRSFNDEASKVGHEEPPRLDHACFANGCPLGASIISAGRKLCFVHYFAKPAIWSAATARIRDRVNLVQASEMLRSGGERVDIDIVDAAQRIVPDMPLAGCTHYTALLLVERRLLIECTADDETGPKVRPHDVVQMFRDVVTAKRMPA